MVNCRTATRNTLERHFKDHNPSVFKHKGKYTTVYDYLESASIKDLRNECYKSNRYQRSLRRRRRAASRSRSRPRRRAASRSRSRPSRRSRPRNIFWLR